MRRPVLPDQVLVDEEDLHLLASYNKWHISKRGDVVSYKESGSRTNRKRHVYKLHRVIMGVTDPKIVVDHRNRNPLDNRRTNLRRCTQFYNGKNTSIKKNNTSGFSGVKWDKARNLWAAVIKYDYKSIHLGRYDTIEEAISARLFAEAHYFKEFSPNA